MKTSKYIENIPAYLDGSLSEKEREAFEDALRSDSELKTYFDAFREMEISLTKETLSMPSSNFTYGVMQNLDKYPRTQMPSIFNALLLIFTIIGIVSICIFLTYSGAFDSANTVISLNKISHKEIPSTAIPFNGKLVINAVIFLNLVLALLILDKAVFKPLFLRKFHMNE